MSILVHAQRSIRAPAQAVFDLLLDPARFPATFRGYGPIAAIDRITLDGTLHEGAMRRIHQSDGVVLSERIDVLDPPRRHAYTLRGFVPPFSWLVREGHADWKIEATTSGTHVDWTYRFVPTASWLTLPLGLLLRPAMGGAMRRCLEQFALTLEPEAAAGSES